MKKIFSKVNLIVILGFIILLFGTTKVNATKVSVGQVEGVSIKSQTSSSITVSWKKVKKITGYKVYVYNSSKKKYEYYKSTNNTKLEIKKLSSAKEYKIKVRAYKKVKGKEYYGKYSSVKKEITTPAKVKNLAKKSVSTNSIKISWNKVSRATGYKVYLYNSSKKKYEYYGKTSNTTMTIKKLKSSKQYKIKVRAYKTYNKNQYFGSYSSILKVTTKYDYKKEIQEIEDKVKKQEKKTELQIQMNSISAKITELKREIQKLESELEDVNSELRYIDRKESKTRWIELQQKAISLNGDIATKTYSLQAYEDEYNALKAQRDSL